MSESRAVTVVEEVRHTLNMMTPQFKMALPQHVTPEKFVRTVMTAIQQKPEILECDRRSIYASCMLAAQDGLMLDGREAALTPRGGKASYARMVAGLCKMIRNSGEIREIDAAVVYEKDEYESWVDEGGPHFKHTKARGDRGEIVLTYAYAIGTNGAKYHEEIPEDEMKSIRALGAKNGPWAGPFDDEMRRKSAIRRLGKYRLPLSTDIAGQLQVDDPALDPDVKVEDIPGASSAPAAKPAPASSTTPKGASRTRAAVLGGETDSRPEPPPIEGSSTNVTGAPAAAATPAPVAPRGRTEPPKFEESDIV